MKVTQIFPALMALESLGASIVYGAHGDWRMCKYWLCAAGLTYFITF